MKKNKVINKSDCKISKSFIKKKHLISKLG